MCQTVPPQRFVWALALLAVIGGSGCDGEQRQNAEDDGPSHEKFLFDSADPAARFPAVYDSDEDDGSDPEEEFGRGPQPHHHQPVLGAGGQPRAKRAGDVLAVLGADGALSVMDIGGRALLSRYYKAWGETPLRLELQGHVAIAVFQDPSRKAGTTGTLLALDIADPERPRAVAELTIEGQITRVERNGDVLYVLADRGDASELTSFDISDPSAIEQVSRLSFADSKGDQLWWKPQLALSGSRAYVFTPDAIHAAALTMIDVVDVSSTGEMHAGMRITVGGAVLSAGYVSESGGVLRVLGSSVPSDAPSPSDHVVVHTFRIGSANEIERIANADFPLSQGDDSMIHFADAMIDGDRAYVMSKVAEGGDYFGQLTLIDLSDAEAPALAGRVDVGLPIAFLPLQGRALVASNPYDTTQIRLDLLDVSDIAAPRSIAHTKLSDGSQNGFAESLVSFMQHLDDGTVAVGYPLERSDSCDHDLAGRVQTFDLASGALDPNRAFETDSPPRQALSTDDALLVAMDRDVARFDRDAVDAQDQVRDLRIAPEVTSSVVLDDRLLRFSKDGSFDVTTFDRAELPSAERFRVPDVKTSWCPWASWAARAGDDVQVIRWEQATGGEEASQMLLSTIELAPKQAAPHVAAPLVLKHVFEKPVTPAVTSGEAFAFLGPTLASYRYVDRPELRNFVDIAAIDDLSHSVTQTFELPGMSTGLLTGDDVIVTSHSEPAGHGRVHFFLDRFDVTDPQAPRALPKLNIPGSLLAINAGLDRLITVDYERETLDDVTRAECADRFGWGAEYSYAESDGTCERRLDTIRLVSIENDAVAIVRSFELPREVRLIDAAAGELVAIARGSDGTEHRAVLVRATPDDSLEVSVIDPEGETFERTALSGSHAFLIGLDSNHGNTGVIELSAKRPELRVLDVPGPVQHVSTHAATAYFSLGPNGLAAIDLSDAGAP